MKSILGFFLLVLANPLSAAEELRGRVLEKVACAADPSQSYALYLPSGYSPDKKWPVIYCFDPGARGKAPVERLRAAAEKYGYIVAGSNVSRNGPWENNFKAIQAMSRDVGAHFAVESGRIYSAGLSGGARVAVQIALEGYSKGVIACSAGFPGEVPGRVAFPVFGTAGAEDMNYHELKALDVALEERKAAHRIVIFDGGHEWASAALMTEGVEWLELQAMKAGTLAKDPAVIGAIWRARLAGLPRAATLERWRELKSVAADFKGLTDTAAVESEMKTIGAARETKEALKVERTLMARERDLDAKLADLTDARASEKAKFAAEIRVRADVAADSPERRMVRRRLASYQASVRENVRGLWEDSRYEEAASMLELAVLLRPGQSRTLFDLARARAFARDPKRALEALRQAGAAGFSDATRAEAEPAFAKVKGDPAFWEILAEMRNNPPEPERRGGEFGGRGRF